ncbi:hypothetical protein C8A01DRAFT_48440 [Parachaetomium inaequale]|uniref:Uncharacterized protein n=1 Tax=Parachaetomium inaequale TaxID=2588326 RepID=A0AAN6PC42_9PEZI|nr:hypothetical protein C8A01DRAFT_48440 [Parachaetomium inaequale]
MTGLFHLGQCIYYRPWSVTALLPSSCALLAAGFATRSYGTFHYEDPQVYTASILLLYASPPLLQWINYLILNRRFYFVFYFAPMHPARMLVDFATLTAVIELLIIGGWPTLPTGMHPTVLETADLFMLAGIYQSYYRGCRIKSPRVMRSLFVSYARMLFILGRAIYRAVEHFGVPASRTDLDPLSLKPVVRYEWYFYVFDAALVFLAIALWKVGHLSRYLPDDPRMYLAQDGARVLKEPGWNDSQSKTEAIFNPFAMLKGNDGNQKKFWEQNGYNMGTVRMVRR